MDKDVSIVGICTRNCTEDDDLVHCKIFVNSRPLSFTFRECIENVGKPIIFGIPIIFVKRELGIHNVHTGTTEFEVEDEMYNNTTDCISEDRGEDEIVDDIEEIEDTDESS